MTRTRRLVPLAEAVTPRRQRSPMATGYLICCVACIERDHTIDGTTWRTLAATYDERRAWVAEHQQAQQHPEEHIEIMAVELPDPPVQEPPPPDPEPHPGEEPKNP